MANLWRFHDFEIMNRSKVSRGAQCELSNSIVGKWVSRIIIEAAAELSSFCLSQLTLIPLFFEFSDKSSRVRPCSFANRYSSVPKRKPCPEKKKMNNVFLGAARIP